jgi:hypothetical protein
MANIIEIAIVILFRFFSIVLELVMGLKISPKIGEIPPLLPP